MLLCVHTALSNKQTHSSTSWKSRCHQELLCHITQPELDREYPSSLGYYRFSRLYWIFCVWRCPSWSLHNFLNSISGISSSGHWNKYPLLHSSYWKSHRDYFSKEQLEGSQQFQNCYLSSEDDTLTSDLSLQENEQSRSPSLLQYFLYFLHEVQNPLLF